MARFLKQQNARVGQPPGSLIFVGQQMLDKPRLRVIDYDAEHLQELELTHLQESVSFLATDSVTWINIDGLHDVDLIQEVGDTFGIHPLTLEDILNTSQRPKIEEYDTYLFIVVKMLRYDEEDKVIQAEQLSLILADTFLITFQERVGDVFEPVRERIRKGRVRIRSSGTDYLAYTLLDSIVDNYLMLVGRLGEDIEDLEATIFHDPPPDTLETINRYKRELTFVRKAVRPAREMIQTLTRMDSAHLSAMLPPFLKDLYDLIQQATDALDTYNDMLSDQLSIYHTTVSTKMNEIMKVLTIFAAIFIPLTFIAGIYGTNFEYVPELGYQYSYFIFWGVLLFVGGVMVVYFRRKGWL